MISNETTDELTIYVNLYFTNILPTRATFSVSSAGKLGNQNKVFLVAASLGVTVIQKSHP